MNTCLNIAAYRFVSLSVDQLIHWREVFRMVADKYFLKGTILLSQEGINLFLAGLPENIQQWQQFLDQYLQFKNLHYRESWSAEQPFKRLRVRIKKEIITMGQANIRPENQPASEISPSLLNRWYQEKRPVIMLDVRNDYEVKAGTFTGAVDLNLRNFRSFPEAVTKLPSAVKEQTVVTFCTGGIRCEKAALWLQQQGYQDVYQLQGGILNYFAQCGAEYFQGECFVFDERGTINNQVLTKRV